MALTPSGDFTRYLAQNYYTKTELQAGALSTIYFTESEHIATSAGAGDAGKPIKLNSSGQVDSTMIAGGSLATHIADTSTHGVAVAIVGTTETQTLTNKTLTAPVVDGVLRVQQTAASRYYSSFTMAAAAATWAAYDDTDSVYLPLTIAGETVSQTVAAASTVLSGTTFAITGDLTVSGSYPGSGDVATHAADTSTHGVAVAIVGTTDAQTLTNKTLTSPIISTISNTGTLTLPTSTDTLVGRATTDTLTNKTLTTPVVGGDLRVQQSGASRYHSLFAMSAGAAVWSAYDDTGSVYLPLTLAATSITQSIAAANAVLSGTTFAVTGSVTASVGISIGGAAVPTVSSSSTLTNKTLTDPLISRVYGSSAANGDVTLEGTSNATRTTSYAIIQPNGGKTVVGGSDADHDFEVQNRADDDYRITVNLNSSGKNYINSYSTTTATFTGAPLHLFGSRIVVDSGIFNLGPTSSPASNATGTAGDITWDTSYIYIATAANTWKRAALTGGY